MCNSRTISVNVPYVGRSSSNRVRKHEQSHPGPSVLCSVTASNSTQQWHTDFTQSDRTYLAFSLTPLKSVGSFSLHNSVVFFGILYIFLILWWCVLCVVLKEIFLTRIDPGLPSHLHCLFALIDCTSFLEFLGHL